MSDMVTCRYNKAHKVKRTRLFIHEAKCPDAKLSNLQTCPYNAQHKVSFENMEAHKKKCPDKPQIDPKIMNEMKKYIQMVKENDEPPKADEIIDEDKKDQSNSSNSKNEKIECINFNQINVDDIFTSYGMSNNVVDINEIENYSISSDYYKSKNISIDESNSNRLVKK